MSLRSTKKKSCVHFKVVNLGSHLPNVDIATTKLFMKDLQMFHHFAIRCDSVYCWRDPECSDKAMLMRSMLMRSMVDIE